jgi:hypothetical protein
MAKLTTSLVFTPSNNISQTLSNSSFNKSNLNGKFKNDIENQLSYSFITKAYIINHNLFNYCLLDINYNKERLIICLCTQEDCSFSFSSKAKRF